jgi:anti-sigma regulatory factor (Ser/Thr protein kinase)
MAPSVTATATGRTPRCAGQSGRRRFSLPLEHCALAPATARRAAAKVLASWGMDEDHAHDVLLVISELVTNAIAYASPPIVLRLTIAASTGTGLQVRVTDGGPAPAPTTWSAHRPREEHGRGTRIITALTQTTGTQQDPEGLIDHWANLTPG